MYKRTARGQTEYGWEKEASEASKFRQSAQSAAPDKRGGMEGFPFAAPVLGQVHVAFVSEYSSTGASTVILITLSCPLSDKDEQIVSVETWSERLGCGIWPSSLLLLLLRLPGMLSCGLTCLTRRPIHLRSSSSPQRRHQLRLQRTNSPPNSNHESPTQTQTLRPLVVCEEHVCLFARLSELLVLESSDSHAREPSPDRSRSPYVRTERVTILTPC